ncbi:hypothetical protein D6774_03230 [Candidatus Woesearchaeota archaeon]|nr:MAG: hypothetical protein D6774_03230 [Candidatus Woesearchaeota archaeon]
MITIPAGSGSFSTVRYTGPFDWDKIQSYIFKEFSDWDVAEKVHKHKKSGVGIEKEIEWEFTIKATDLLLYKVGMSFHVWDWVQKEVVVDGKKRKMDYGRVEFKMNWSIQADWQGKYTQGIAAKLFNFYIYHLKKKDLIVTVADPFKYRMLHVQEQIKKLLGQTGYNPEGFKSE